MPTPAAAASLLSNGRNLVSSVKQIGVQEGKQFQGRALNAQQQQFMISANEIAAMNKGSNLSVNILNTSTTNRRAFTVFDPCGIAVSKGAPATHADITITTTFAGGADYDAFLEWTKGTHVGSIGTIFEFSEESEIKTSNVLVWNGNIEDYNSKSMKNYFILAKDTYSNDPKTLVVASTLYLNSFFAMSGTLGPEESIEITFNVVLFNNF